MHSEASFKPLQSGPLTEQNLTHGLRSGLVGAWLFNEGYGSHIENFASITGDARATMQTTPEWSGSPWGSALRFRKADSDWAQINYSATIKPTTYPFAFAARACLLSSTTALYLWTNDDTQNTYAGILLMAWSTGAYSIRIGDNAGLGSTHRRALTCDTAATIGDWSSIVFNVYSATSAVAYLNGRSVSITTEGTGGALAYTANSYGSMGREDVSGSVGPEYSEHLIDYIYFWTGRDIGAGDALRLSIDPYCIFENRSMTKFFVTAPAGTGWSHKLNAVSNASISKINGVSKASISKVNSVA